MRRRDVLMVPVAVTGLLACAATLSGCSPAVRRTNSALDEAVSAVDGVVSQDVRVGTGGTFQQIVSGEVVLDAAEESALIAIYDEVMRAVVTTLAEVHEDSANVELGGVTGVSVDDPELKVSIEVFAADLPDSRPQVGDLYDRYGVT